MRIIVDTGDYFYSNAGDLAMLQVSVERLRELWPEASIEVITRDPAGLARYCPGTRPLSWRGRDIWLNCELLPHRVARLLPRSLRTPSQLRRQSPRLHASALRTRLRLTGVDAKEFEEFFAALEGADLFVLTGAGGFTDHTVGWDHPVLETLAYAHDRGILTAIFGQGFGPLSDRRTLDRAKEVLPRVPLIALRERLTSMPVLDAMGVSDERILITGDDAVSKAYAAAPAQLGDGLGVNLRVAKSSGFSPQFIGQLRPVLQSLSERFAAPMVPVPIARPGDSDAIRELLTGIDDESDGGQSLDSPDAVIAQVGRCRTLITGAYHAAVFALSQGIPVVALVKTPYFRGKMTGLADQFGAGCEVVSLTDRAAPEHVAAAALRAWTNADVLRPTLLDAASRQALASHEAYQKLARIYRRRKASPGRRALIDWNRTPSRGNTPVRPAERV